MNYFQIVALVVGIGGLVVAVLTLRANRAQERREEISVLKEEKERLVSFIDRVAELDESDTDENTLEPLRELLRSCRRVFDDGFFETAIAELDRVRSSKERVLSLLRRIRAVEAADQADLEAAQAELTRTRRQVATLMRDQARDELSRIKGRLEELGQAT